MKLGISNSRPVCACGKIRKRANYFSHARKPGIKFKISFQCNKIPYAAVVFEQFRVHNPLHRHTTISTLTKDFNRANSANSSTFNDAWAVNCHVTWYENMLVSSHGSFWKILPLGAGGLKMKKMFQIEFFNNSALRFRNILLSFISI